MTRLLLALALLLAVGCAPTPPVRVTRTPSVAITYQTRQPIATELPTHTVYPTAVPSMTPIPTATPPATWTPGAAKWVPVFHNNLYGYESFLSISIPVPLETIQGIGVIEVLLTLDNMWDQPRVVQWDVYDPDTGAFYAQLWELEPYEAYSAIRLWAACNWNGTAWQWWGYMSGDKDHGNPHTGTLFVEGWVHHN